MSIFKRTQRKYVNKAYRVRNWREYEASLRERRVLRKGVECGNRAGFARWAKFRHSAKDSVFSSMDSVSVGGRPYPSTPETGPISPGTRPRQVAALREREGRFASFLTPAPSGTDLPPLATQHAGKIGSRFQSVERRSLNTSSLR